MTLIPDTAALYHGDDDGVDIHQGSVNQQSDSMGGYLLLLYVGFEKVSNINSTKITF